MDLFSKRNKKKNQISKLEYNIFPNELRVQIEYVLLKLCDIEIKNGYMVNFDYNWVDIFKYIYHKLCDEYGRMSLSTEEKFNYDDEQYILHILNFISNSASIEEIFDVIELIFDEERYLKHNRFLDKSFDQYIIQLNNRLKEHNIGYRFESGQIIRIDSEYSYLEITVPALQLISDPVYKTVNDEFLEAHKHYKKGEYEEALVDCRKASESCLKIICQKRKWFFDEKKDTFKDLIDIVIKNGLISIIHISGFGGLRAVLESATVLCNDKKAVHGKGADDEITIHDYEAEYVLNITATTLLLLIKTEQNLK